MKVSNNQTDFNWEAASQAEQIEFLQSFSRDTYISHSLLENIGVDCDNIVSQRVVAMTNAKEVLAPKQHKPIIDSILEDISIEKMKREKHEQALQLTLKQFPPKVQAADKNKKLLEFLQTPKKTTGSPLIMKKFDNMNKMTE